MFLKLIGLELDPELSEKLYSGPEKIAPDLLNC
jgi:hypothetical protein